MSDLKPGDMCTNRDEALVTEGVLWVNPGRVMMFLGPCMLFINTAGAKVMYDGEINVVYPADRLFKHEGINTND